MYVLYLGRLCSPSFARHPSRTALLCIWCCFAGLLSISSESALCAAFFSLLAVSHRRTVLSTYVVFSVLLAVSQSTP